MAKTKGPLLSLDAHGSLGDLLTYSHRKSGRQVRLYNKPLVAASAKQRGQRRLTEFLVAQWQHMSDADKATWEANARLSGPHITGYHYFLREAHRDLYTHHGLCGYWHCNEIVGGKVLDLSGNRNHGTLKPSHPSNAPILTPSISTRFSNALLYDGVDEYIDCGNGVRFNWIGNQLTLSLWVKFDPATATMNQYILNKMAAWPSADGAWRFRAGFARKLFFGVKTGAWVDTAGYKITTAWHQVTATYNNVKIRLYIDTVLVKEANQSGNITIENVPVRIGGNYGAQYVKGLLDEVCVYNRALSTAEILTRYRFAMREVD